MELMDAINNRRAVRDYTADAVEQPVLESLIHAAVQAPSAVDTQPWRFVVLRERQLLDRISREAKAQRLLSEPVAELRAHLENPGFHIFYHAPALILIAAEHQAPWVVEDCALAAQNLMLAAYAAGLGSCWIGFAQAYLDSAPGKQLLGIPQSWVAVAPIIVGHPRSAPPPHPRHAPQIRWIG